MNKKKISFILTGLLLASTLQIPHLGKIYAAEGEVVTNIPFIKVTGVKNSSNDGNLPEYTIDNDLSTRWAASGDGEWIQYDLGESKPIGYIGISFNNGDKRVAKFEIHVSEDEANWTKVYSGVSSGKSLNLESFDFEDVNTRYVRIVGFGNSSNKWNSYFEVQIYPPNEKGAVVNQLELPNKGSDPKAKPYSKPGLYDPDGKEHSLHAPNKVTGTTIDVTKYGADTADNDKDDTLAIQTAINEAKPGDEIYLPNGVYNLNTTDSLDKTSNLVLRSGVNLRGESTEGVKLVSGFKEDTGVTNKTIKAYGVENVVVSNLTLTSAFDGKYSTNTKVTNPEKGGPVYGMHINYNAGKPSNNITIDNVIVEKYQSIGIKIEKSHDVIVKNSLFRNATDVAGGGAGYGVCMQGTAKVNRLGMSDDSYFNVVENSTFEGPYIRHGVLIQNYSHNNTVRNNNFTGTLLDAVDLHGEFEYLNEVYGNNFKDIKTGAAVGLGNTGGTAPTNHSASGPKNYIHDNTIENCKTGVSVIMGTPDTIIENNIIKSSSIENSTGILVLNGPRTIIKDNTILDNLGPNAAGIALRHDKGDTNANNIGEGDPKDVQILNNKVTNNTNGVLIEFGTGTIIKDNDISNNKVNDLLNTAKETPVQTDEAKKIEEIKKSIEDLKITGSAKAYDELILTISNAKIPASDKDILLTALASAGQTSLWTSDYSQAVSLVVKAWADKEFIAEAENAVQQVNNKTNQKYLSDELAKVKAKFASETKPEPTPVVQPEPGKDITIFFDNFDDPAKYPGTSGNTALPSPWVQEDPSGSEVKTAYSTTASHSSPNRIKIDKTDMVSLGVNTTGYENIKVSYWTLSSSYKGGSIITEWSKDGGTTWTEMENYKPANGAASDPNTLKTWALGSEASNNPNFRVRIKVGDKMDGNMYIDDFTITGQAIPGATPAVNPVEIPVSKVPTERTYKVAKGAKLYEAVEIGMAGDKPIYASIAVPEAVPEKPMPVVVYIHGGGWNKGTRLDSASSITNYIARGYIGVTLDYRLTGEAPFPAQIEDVKLAIRYLRANADKYYIDPSRIGVWGSSAGSHLAALLGTSADEPSLEGTGGYAEYSTRVQAVVDNYGPVDFTSEYANNYSSVTALLGGKKAFTVPDEARKAMPGTYASKDDAAFFIRHGDADTTVPYEQSISLAEQLQAAGVYVDFQIIPGAGHGFKGHPMEKQISDETWAFLDKFVKNLEVKTPILKKASLDK